MTDEERDKILVQLRAETMILNKLVAFLFFSLPDDIRETCIESFDLPLTGPGWDEQPEVVEVLEKTRSKFLREVAALRKIKESGSAGMNPRRIT